MKMYEFDQNFILNGPTGNKSLLVQVMAWRQTGDKLLSELMGPQFTDAYMRHSASMS